MRPAQRDGNRLPLHVGPQGRQRLACHDPVAALDQGRFNDADDRATDL
jgi:hypothetical protein